jgi:hypothetical protein
MALIGKREHTGDHDDYVLGYAKNRSYQDVCTNFRSTSQAFPQTQFLATFARRALPLTSR